MCRVPEIVALFMSPNPRLALGTSLLLSLLAGCATLPGQTDATPPGAFPADGCTWFPDADYRHCCDVHDRVYWCGGTPDQRRQADRALAECVEALGRGVRAQLMYAGVRVGGSPWLPAPWRWGFGWPYGRGYTQSPMSCTPVGAH